MDRFVVFVATLSLLSEAAEERPIIAVVDDAQWLDAASAEALLFVARRLLADRVALVFGAREGDVRTFLGDGLPELVLDGLDSASASALLTERAGAPVNAEVCAALVAQTGGSPLALMEMPAVLSVDQLAGKARLPTRYRSRPGLSGRSLIEPVGCPPKLRACCWSPRQMAPARSRRSAGRRWRSALALRLWKWLNDPG